jgi:membrane protein implicated in regulation of membrane protease activity
MWWLIAAAALGLAEVITTTLVFAMLAVGAAAGAAISALGAGQALSVIVFLVVSVALLAVVRPIATRHLSQPPAQRTGVAALIGAHAVVTERVDAHGGRIKLAGEVWSARSYDSHAVLEVGQSVDVIQIDGATALVL